MPTHRGIKISVVSQLELKLHPEFPHPESSQFTYRSPDLRKGATKFTDWTPPSASSDSKADRLLGRQSVVSVYIPSMPATRFWIRYNIVEAASTHSDWFYFKLFMNGRLITSWGTNAKTKPSGQVMRGLFEPSGRWNYKHDGTVYHNMGTEARPFIFGYEEEDLSAANDGGLIEVMVFRARGRKRRLQKPMEFKDQEAYGIMQADMRYRMPSGGLLDRPQEAKFYDWHLKDPKDSPFATFKFHYRSWDSLKNLQLIPHNHPRTLLPASPSVLSLNGASQDLHSKLEEDTDEEEIIAHVKRSMSSMILNDDPWLTSVFDDSPERVTSSRNSGSSFVVPPEVSPLFSRRPSTKELPTSRFSTAVIDKPASPQNSWKGYLDRPLPEVPSRNNSLRRQQNYEPSGHTRNSSGISHAPSIAASLLPYLDRDSASPEPIIGIAEVVEVSPTIPFSSPIRSSPSPEEPSTKPTRTQRRQGIAFPPPNTLFSMTNITVRKTRKSPLKRLSIQQSQDLDFYSPSPSHSPCPAPSRSKIQPPSFDTLPSENDGYQAENENENDQPTLDTSQNTTAISESEWMCRTPSPVKASGLPRFESLQKLWSPGLDNKRSSRETTGTSASVMGMGMEVIQEQKTENENVFVSSRSVRSRSGSSGPMKNRTRDWYDGSKRPEEHVPDEDDVFGNEDMKQGNWI
ncbi:uncharacterized protein RCO7_07817 [Rhynchosporium graminicola]|uniref:DUF7918 domain-containing protein n=1 Tax=Rhynchosporium graminicola TaxID=2792576 RepID=A0A1E1K4X5_9HELO|nr:uncharacterized protein RCO7_07817 [Rhynchosporium commune]